MYSTSIQDVCHNCNTLPILISPFNSHSKHTTAPGAIFTLSRQNNRIMLQWPLYRKQRQIVYNRRTMIPSCLTAPKLRSHFSQCQPPLNQSNKIVLVQTETAEHGCTLHSTHTHITEAVDLLYMGSISISDGYYRPNTRTTIRLAPSVMVSLRIYLALEAACTTH